MSDFDIKKQINDSATLALHRVHGGRMYHVFEIGQMLNQQIATCGFQSSYPLLDADRPMAENTLDYYPLCEKCKAAFLKLEQCQ